MKRRDLLKSLGGGAVAAACPVCLGAARAEEAWGYFGDRTAMTWAALEGANRACLAGSEQSPINLAGAVKADLAPPRIDYQSTALKITNDGHTIRVTPDAGSVFTIDGAMHRLAQFHFHHPSEHQVNGRALDMELHFVNQHHTGKLAVLGVLMTVGRPNPAVEAIWKLMPTEAGPEQSFPDVIKLADLLPDTRRYYRYQGSLTTPPCSETVTWTVLKEPLQISADQVARFAKLFPMNARPVAPLNRRFLLERDPS